MTYLEVIACCRRISEADPLRDYQAEDELRCIGVLLHAKGGTDLMQQVIATADHTALTAGNQWAVSALCNSKWHGIGKWER